MTRYSRAPSNALRAALEPRGVLGPLLQRRSVRGLALDVHLREGDHLHVYCGLTRLVDASLTRKHARIKAHPTYTNQACGTRLFRDWPLAEDGFAETLHHYYDNVLVGDRHLRGEGAVQAAWSALESPWFPFDREAVLGYGPMLGRAAGASPAVLAALSDLESMRGSGGWATPGPFGGEVDQLGIDVQGRLVLIELKDAASSPSKVYHSPLQLLQYVHEWAAAYEQVRPGLDALREARIAVGLSPPHLPMLSGGLRAVIGFGEDARSDEVRARFDVVLDIVNRHLPHGLAPIEVWKLTDGRPALAR
jgi:hypothetical protein